MRKCAADDDAAAAFVVDMDVDVVGTTLMQKTASYFSPLSIFLFLNVPFSSSIYSVVDVPGSIGGGGCTWREW